MIYYFIFHLIFYSLLELFFFFIFFHLYILTHTLYHYGLMNIWIAGSMSLKKPLFVVYICSFIYNKIFMMQKLVCAGWNQVFLSLLRDRGSQEHWRGFFSVEVAATLANSKYCCWSLSFIDRVCDQTGCYCWCCCSCTAHAHCILRGIILSL